MGEGGRTEPAARAAFLFPENWVCFQYSSVLLIPCGWLRVGHFRGPQQSLPTHHPELPARSWD